MTYPNGDRIVADRRAVTADGWIGGVEITGVSDIAALATVTPEKVANTSVNVNQFHNRLGHPGMATTMTTAKVRKVVLKA